MEIALLIGRLLLAAVFVVAGVAKLADRVGSRQALVDFGLPARFASPLAILLPIAEIAVALALVPLATAWFGALGALALLLVFVAGIGYNLARGRTPDCHCFGHLYSAPAGWPTLARNAVLSAIAGGIVWQGQETAGASAVSWMASLTPPQILGSVFRLLLLGVMAVEAWFLLNLLRQHGRLLLRIEALEDRVETNNGVPDPCQHHVRQPASRLEAQPRHFGSMASTASPHARPMRTSNKPSLLVSLIPDVVRVLRCSPTSLAGSGSTPLH